MWRTKLFPELLLLDGVAERNQLLRDAKRQMKHRGWYSAAVCVGVIASILAPQYFERRIGAYFSVARTRLLGILVTGLAVAAVVWAIQRLWYKPLRDQIRRELIERGIPVCLRCGYNLTGLSEPRCPECGTSFDPHESAI
jgi:uncharacterized paraquat-inducible protein A